MKDTADIHNCSADQVVIPQVILEQILQEARSAPDVEICGLIAARQACPLRCIPIRNVAAKPQHVFNMDPGEQIDAFRQMRERGETLFGIYHSHPDAPAEPSAIDISEAGYPDALQFIVSLHTAAAPEIRGYRFCNGGALPVQLKIQPPAG